MTQNPNHPQFTPEVPQWIAGTQQPADPQAPANQYAGVQAPVGPPQSPVGGQASAVQAAESGKSRWRSNDGKPSGLALAGAGSLLAVLAFLGGTAVGHAWGGSTGTDQTQFGGPGGGGRFRQLPGQGTQPGQGTLPGQGQVGPGQGQGQGQGTVPGQGNQPSTGTQDS